MTVHTTRLPSPLSLNFKGMSINQSSCLPFAFKGLVTDFVCGTLAPIQEFDHKVRELTEKLSRAFTFSKLEQSL